MRILGVDVDGGRSCCSATADSLLPGDYSFWFDGDTRARARRRDPRAESTIGRPASCSGSTSATWHGARAAGSAAGSALSPRDSGYPYENVAVATPLGDAPAWLIPAGSERPSTDRWVIQVHGRAVRRSEALRAVAPFRDAGYTSLLVSYRNDGDAPRSDDFRYALGDAEWLDVEAAIRFALDRGATRHRADGLVDGRGDGAAGAHALAARGCRARRRAGVAGRRLGGRRSTSRRGCGGCRRSVRAGVLTLLKSRWAGFFTGLAEPLDFDRLDFVRRATELDRPILLLHSDDDGFVPATASRALAAARPDIVTFVPFEVARHTKLWNYDRTRWEDAIRDWLASARSSEPDTTARRPIPRRRRAAGRARVAARRGAPCRGRGTHLRRASGSW